jgi:stearoyl-CoA desaturase (Delta-9 desaturase)
MASFADLLFTGAFDLTFWQLVLVTLALTHVTIAAVTIYLHRHQAHRALDLHAIPSHFFRFWLWMTTGMLTKEWAAIHRKHHAKCETPEDPHSPKTYGINRVLWSGVLLYVAESRNKETMERYGHGTPDDWMERNVYKYSLMGPTLMGVIDVAMFGVVPGLIILTVQLAWIPFWAAGVINGIGHWFGYRNFNSADMSRNIVPWGIWIGGEELHNNHHAYGTSAKLSNKWYEFDIGWMYIRILEMMGLARVKFVAPEPKLIEASPAIDMQTLQAVIANRYDVMARYGRSLRHALVSEMDALKAKAQLSREERRSYQLVKRSLKLDVSELDSAHHESIKVVMSKHASFAMLYSMREELAAIWGRSSASREQLLQQLQDWCAKAEASGSAYLQELSLRMRSYSLQPAMAHA